MDRMAIDPNTGEISVESCNIRLVRGVSINTARTALASFYRTHIDHGNGYEWLALHHLSFHDQPCGLSVGFKNGALVEVHWSVALPNAPTENGWPTHEAIEQEVRFVRTALSKELSRSFSSGLEQFPWGEVWARFSPKGFMASSGIRYA